MGTYLLSDRVLLHGEKLTVTPSVVHIEGNEITSVAPLDRGRWRAPDATHDVVDVGDRLVTPAFINGHTHLSMSAFRGIGLSAMGGNIVEELYFRLESAITAEDVHAFVRMGAYDSLLSGVGTVWDHYYHADAIAEALVEVGLTGVVAPTLQDLDGPGVPFLEAQLDATVRLAQNATMAADGVVAALGPHATDTVSDPLWQRIGQLADQHGLWIHVHVAQSVEEYDRSVERHGCSPVTRLDGGGFLDAGAGMLLVHGLFLPQGDLKRLNPARNILGFCPFSQIQFAFPAAIDGWWAAGIPFVVGTDCGACNDSMNVQQELRLIASGHAFAITPSSLGQRFLATGALDAAQALDALRRDARQDRHALMAPETLLDTVWGIPGDLHPGLRVGRIEAGRRANIAVWDLNHPACWPATDPFRTLTMSDMGPALWAMMTNGVWRGEPGRFRDSIVESDAYREACTEASARLGELMARLGL